MIRVQRRTAGSYLFTATATDDAGHVQPVAAPVSATITDGAGVVVTMGTPMVNGGSLEWSVPAEDLPALDQYRITWTGTVNGAEQSWSTDAELVGGYLFEIPELRSRDRAFTDATKYPSSLLAAKRVEVEDTFEGPKAAGVAFVPRGRRVTLDGFGLRTLRVPDYEVRRVYSVTANGVAWDTEQVEAIVCDDDRLHLPAPRIWPSGWKNIVVHYEHGLDAPPAPIRRAALTLAREYLAGSDLPGRATATSVGDQMFRLTVAGRDGVTGLPEVDAALDQHGRKRYVIG